MVKSYFRIDAPTARSITIFASLLWHNLSGHAVGVLPQGTESVGEAPRARRLIALFADERLVANRLLTYALAAVVGLIALANIPRLQSSYPSGIDVEIPLRAAAHWASGVAVYPPSAMQVQGGPDLPYLYPPFLLPFLAQVSSLPHGMVVDVWFCICALAAIWTFRRLAISWIAVPCLLAWPPTGEALVVGNIQILLFAAFVAVFYEPRAGVLRQRPLRRDRDLLNGVLAGFTVAIKVGNFPVLIFLARRRFRAAVLGAAMFGLFVLATLPLTGTAIYFDWLAQLQRASDPGWAPGGLTLSHHIGVPDAVTVAIGMAAAFLLRGRDSVAWVGIALILATPNAHGHTFIFLLPALLIMRRDLAILIGALFLSFWTAPMWVAWGLAAVVLAASNRWPRLRVSRLQDPIASGPRAGARAEASA